MGAVQIPPGAKVLDAGCGYGIIGLFAAVEGAGLVHLVDNNLLAVEACRETLSVNGIKNAEVSAGDLLNPWFRINMIWCSPIHLFTQGKLWITRWRTL